MHRKHRSIVFRITDRSTITQRRPKLGCHWQVTLKYLSTLNLALCFKNRKSLCTSIKQTSSSSCAIVFHFSEFSDVLSKSRGPSQIYSFPCTISMEGWAQQVSAPRSNIVQDT